MPAYRAIYIEEEALNWPLTRQVLARSGGCPLVFIRHYKDVFNRPNQDIRLQKQKPALILAVRQQSFLYPGPAICQHFGHDRFYYAALLQNCLFDCSYCYLQGLLPSADLLAFVNIPDFVQEIKSVAKKGPVYLALSHDSDLLAMHSQLPYLEALQAIWPQLPGLQAEVRSKSGNPELFRLFPPLANLVFAFSLAPQAVIDRYEKKTPGLEARLRAAAAALNLGHPVRVCFDPVFADPDLESVYPEFFDQVFRRLEPGRIRDVSYGFFRLPLQISRKISRRRPDAAFFRASLVESRQQLSYAADRQAKITKQHLGLLRQYLKPGQIFLLDDPAAEKVSDALPEN